MDAKKCDRCGNYYTKSEYTNIKLLIAAFIGANVSPLRLAEAQIEIEKNLDLCPECSKDLTKWLRRIV